ncbi:MAG: rRNA maturation RNase YbeY [Oscillospiraceae bacterium]|nr:rRNA maturation RNase YbeY [Oscillospiraceae bacterium]MBR2897256.1 rRNA maturation RNase YbeY [Oscillospiraceae bacterium]MBR2977921.1 rRNA maturation RNase YbeY [Oscillospiraceae bacterium]MBR3849249.1 rRNA maturation RNase YbeY [Oscillospiraceae bacterium]
MEHKLNISFWEQHPIENLRLRRHLRGCISTALRMMGVKARCEINVLITNDAGIHEINKALRQIDRPTDVLSFPMFSLEAGVLPESWDDYTDPETGCVPLGDMTISLERAKAQAEEYGHSVRRELGYLTIHSILHLLGYDHEDEEDKRLMRREEEKILAELLLPR